RPDPRRALGPAAKSAAQTGRTRDRTRPMLQQRQKVLAKAPSTRDPKRTSAGRSATCGSARCHPLTSPFRALVHPQSLYIHPSAQFADVHGGMFFESRCDAIFDVLPACWPPDLFALRLRLACNGRLFYSNLLNLGRR